MQDVKKVVIHLMAMGAVALSLCASIPILWLAHLGHSSGRSSLVLLAAVAGVVYFGLQFWLYGLGGIDRIFDRIAGWMRIELSSHSSG